MQPKRYEIVTLPDFLKVPQDRMPACLKDFEEYIEACRQLAKAPWIEPIKFTWIDDGIEGISGFSVIVSGTLEREDS